MPVTVLNEGPLGETIIAEDEAPRVFSWSAAFAGAFIATAVTFFLLTLGSGIGLSLVTVHGADSSGTTTFLTLGAIYFLVAQAFGFAAGGHVVGRLIGPALETDREEEFRAGTHGLVAWALAVVATATLAAASILLTGTSTTVAALSAPHTDSANQPVVTGYWVDTLFRPADEMTHASLAWRQYAQVDTGTATDATNPPPATAEPTQIMPNENPVTPVTRTTPAGHDSTVYMNGAATTPVTTNTILPVTPTHSIGADKAEAGRILTVGMADGARLLPADRAQVARLVAQDTGLTMGASLRRVEDVEGRMRAAAVKTADMARKAAAYASLWTALALLFGGVVAAAAAISARWEADREALLPGTRVSETRF